MKKSRENPQKSVQELEIMISTLQKENQEQKNKIISQQQEIISQKERYIRLLEEFRLEKHRIYSSSSEKNILQSDLFDEAGIELAGELKDMLDDTIDIPSYQRKKHPVRNRIRSATKLPKMTDQFPNLFNFAL